MMRAMKFIKFIIALLLLPTTFSLTKSLYSLTLHQADAANTLFSPLTYGLISGLLLLLILPSPIRTYVLGHELTHALWGLCMGARVGKINVTKNGGHVELSKTNFLITLPPIFFPSTPSYSSPSTRLETYSSIYNPITISSSFS
jgi:hypothetical protein